ncbi:hypothetical protein TNCV_3454731 [Trichonephila clavipes]|nr:hypothetical protein TNCV_3454731 [Trichonephila clavipes]
MGPPRNIAIKFEEQYCLDVHIYFRALVSNHMNEETPLKHPPPFFMTSMKLCSQRNAGGLAKHPQHPDMSIGLLVCKERFITPKNLLPYVHSLMTVSFAPLQSTLRILASDVLLMSGCTIMENPKF